jgi:hypothetical protein
MFTGIVTAKGSLTGKTELGGDCRLEISCPDLHLEAARAGDSICVSGACLTMLDPDRNGFSADVSQETLSLTTLGSLGVGAQVNLELALAAADRLGGHLVTGHVDGMAPGIRSPSVAGAVHRPQGLCLPGRRQPDRQRRRRLHLLGLPDPPHPGSHDAGRSAERRPGQPRGRSARALPRAPDGADERGRDRG